MSSEVQNNDTKALSTTIDAQKVELLIDNFLSSQDIRESSKQLYKRTLRQYFNWVNKKGYDLSKVARPQILEYKEDLFKEGLSSLTVGSYITAVRRLYDWLEANKIYPNVAKGIKTPYRKKQFRKQALTPEQATELLEYYKGKALRDFAIVNLLLRTGLRTIEVSRANIEDITFKGNQRVLVIQGKGRDEKDDFVILTDSAYKPIARYLKSRGKVNSGEPLFVSNSNNNKGKRLSTRTISYIAKEGLKAIGLDNRGFTAHSLRHTTAVSILRAGGSLETAQSTLRHTNPATTQIYTATIKEEMRLQNSGEALIDKIF